MLWALRPKVLPSFPDEQRRHGEELSAWPLDGGGFGLPLR
jgi:hypothetical protein